MTSQAASKMTGDTLAPVLVPRLRHRRMLSTTEITAVGVSPSTSAAFAIYPDSTPKSTKSWVDTFDLISNSKKSTPKFSGSRAAFSPQGDRIAAVYDSTIQLGHGVEYRHASSVIVRDLASGKTVAELGKDAKAGPLAWSRDGKLLAAGEGEGDTPGSGRMGVWDVRSGNRVGRVMSHIDTVTHAAFATGNKLVTLSRDGTARFSNPTAGRTLSRLEIEGASAINPRLLAVSPDGSSVGSVWGSTVQLWVPQANEVISYRLGAVRSTEGWPLAISPDCRYIACWTEIGFDIMDVSSGTVLAEQTSDVQITSAAFSADSKVLLLGRMDGVAEVWDLAVERGDV